jgi:hypothetical protein
MWGGFWARFQNLGVLIEPLHEEVYKPTSYGNIKPNKGGYWCDFSMLFKHVFKGIP